MLSRFVEPVWMPIEGTRSGVGEKMRTNYLKLMSSIVPLGAVGASLVLGSVLPSAAAERAISRKSSVSEQLAAIREAVFVVAGPEELFKQPDPNLQLTWGNRWNNWGWNRSRPVRRPPVWNNWRNGWPNWNNIWRNW